VRLVLERAVGLAQEACGQFIHMSQIGRFSDIYECQDYVVFYDFLYWVWLDKGICTK
jgi:hypothetical protein